MFSCLLKKQSVDGHDVFSGEMKIFLFTENSRIKTILSVACHLSYMKVGYREIAEDEYTPIHPEGLEHFAVT